MHEVNDRKQALHLKERRDEPDEPFELNMQQQQQGGGGFPLGAYRVMGGGWVGSAGVSGSKVCRKLGFKHAGIRFCRWGLKGRDRLVWSG